MSPFGEPTHLEKVALRLFPKKGKCKRSPFYNGWHRVGLIPFYSFLDGTTPGYRCIPICLHCEKRFKRGEVVVIVNQPRSL